MPLASSLWSQDDTELLVRLSQENPLLGKPALLLLFNSQASQSRSLMAIVGKLNVLGVRQGPGRRGSKRKVESVTDQPETDDGDRSDELSEVSTVQSSGQDKIDHVQVINSSPPRSTSRPSPHLQPRQSTSHTPASPQFSQTSTSNPTLALPAPRPSHPTPKRPKRPPAVADDDDAVTELQAIKTQRGLVRAMAELAEMEKAYLAKHGERE